MMKKTVISVVVPVYNEEAVIHESYSRLKGVMEGLDEPYEVIFVNDGSRDATPVIIRDICKSDPTVRLIDFARNFGHQTAITAGMDYASGDAVVVIDADLQDPPEVIPEMIATWREGFDVVYGQRAQRKGETLFKRFTSAAFYRILQKLTDVEIPVDTGDFRLIDRKVCDALKRVKERNRYVRGIISWLGFRQTGVEFVREKRFAGETKYPLKKMLRFAFDAITSFSYKPLKVATYIGSTVSLGGFAYLLVVLYLKLFTTATVTGWASMMAVTLFFNGVVLMMLGIIGEYIGRIYDEAKGRPLYVVREEVNFARAETPAKAVVIPEKDEEHYPLAA
ncbi:glycosyltransferase family 2 protein [Oryzomonas sagensis]|uniref:Glycosyltransferase family 2 protein n=2 Tax=Oryzomonas sagensis TaxID=2603857 RepID=A0ABQ6TQB9_9BACT|nr:glycosyltransferase family 2 protein [Oryzomonas sagensis]